MPHCTHVVYTISEHFSYQE